MGVTLTSWIPQWNNSPTVAIRIPKVFKTEILEYARALDTNEKPNMAIALYLIDAYMHKSPVDRREENCKPITSPRWYHLNKFREWVLGDRE